MLTKLITRPSSLEKVDVFGELASYCSHVDPISTSEFYSRQQTLAEALFSMNASAYIAEPGASALYYANVSSSSWSLSERPLLLLLSPNIEDDGTVTPQISLLTPSFEATRAKLLPLPAKEVSYPEWPEEVDPFGVAVRALPPLHDGAKIFVDGSIRNFIVDGMQKAAPQANVLTAPVEIRSIRERKSATELEIMKCANEVGDALSITSFGYSRHVLGYPCIHSSCSQTIFHRYQRITGQSSDCSSTYDCRIEGWLWPRAFRRFLRIISLKYRAAADISFAENAALPHGSGTDRALGPSDFALIDCGGSLHGYASDVTRVSCS